MPSFLWEFWVLSLPLGYDCTEPKGQTLFTVLSTGHTLNFSPGASLPSGDPGPARLNWRVLCPKRLYLVHLPPPPAPPELRPSSQERMAPLSDTRKQLMMSIWCAGKDSPTVPLPRGLECLDKKENGHLFMVQIIKAIRVSLKGEARPEQAALLIIARRLNHTASGERTSKMW